MLGPTALAFVAFFYGSLALHAEEVQPDHPLQPGEHVRYSRANLDEEVASHWCPSVCQEAGANYSGRWLKIPDGESVGDGCICGRGVPRRK